jgi:hypothetical protein
MKTAVARGCKKYTPGMKPINVNCSPRVTVDCTKEGKHFLLIKVHTINILLIDFHFIKSKSSMLFLHYDHLNFMLETRQRSFARAYSTAPGKQAYSIFTYVFWILMHQNLLYNTVHKKH